MLRVVMLVLSLNGGDVEVSESFYFDTLDMCECAAAINQNDAIMAYRFGYAPRLYVCDLIEESEA